jgi:hypothetical protein
VFLTSGMGRPSIQPWGPRSPHEAQSRSIAFRSTGKRNNSPPEIVAFKNPIKEVPIPCFGKAI